MSTVPSAAQTAAAAAATVGTVSVSRLGPPRRRDINRSPIYKKWVKLHLIDIHTHLSSFPEYTPDSIFFYDSRHPIRWIHIHGLIVTREEQEKRFLYTLDDGSGQIINAVVQKNFSNILDARLPKAKEVVKVKGTLEIVHEAFQVKVIKIEKCEGFEDQVEFWKEANRIRNEILMPKSTTNVSTTSNANPSTSVDGKNERRAKHGKLEKKAP